MKRRHFLAGMAALAAPSIARRGTAGYLDTSRPRAWCCWIHLQRPSSPTFILDSESSSPSTVSTRICSPVRRWRRAIQSRMTANAGSSRCAMGCRFHDGEPVLARDCVASINRWMKRDAWAKTLALRLDALEAPNDRTVVFRLKKPFPQLPYILAKRCPILSAGMPARLAAANPNHPITRAWSAAGLSFRVERVLGQQPRGASTLRGVSAWASTPSSSTTQ